MAFCEDKNLNNHFYNLAFQKIASYSFIKTITDQPNGTFNSGRYDVNVMMNSVYKFHNFITAGAKKDIVSTTIAVFCDSLNWTEPQEADADIAFQRIVFKVFDKPLHSIAFHLPQGSEERHFLHPMKWHVLEKATGNVVPAHIMPMRHEEKNGVEAVYCCVFFETPLIGPDEGKEYMIETYIRHSGIMRGLKVAPYTEYLAMNNMVDETIEEVNLILMVPKPYRRSLNVTNDASCAGLAYRELSKDDIARISGALDNFKYNAIGCQYQNLKTGERARANFGA